MSRRGESPPEVQRERDAVLGVIRAAGKPIGAVTIIRELSAELRVESAAAGKVWDGQRTSLGPDVKRIRNSYLWVGASDLEAAEAALKRLVEDKVATKTRQELARTVRSAFRTAMDRAPDDRATADHVAELVKRCGDLERQLYLADTRSAEVRQAQERQLRIDAIRALAELAMEVEELTVNEAEPNVLVERIRARALREGLEPIGRAGEQTGFDRSRHRPIGAALRDGSAVYVVRPGYTWHAPGEDVLIGKAVVEE